MSKDDLRRSLVLKSLKLSLVIQSIVLLSQLDQFEISYEVIALVAYRF